MTYYLLNIAATIAAATSESSVLAGFLLIREDYKRRAEFLNKEIAVKVFDKTYKGKAIDVTNNGALKLKDNNNKEHILLIGDIL